MTDYHKPVPPEVKEAYLRKNLDPEELRTVDVLTLFGEADRMKHSYTSRRVPRKPTLDELENPHRREE